jgi:hypothetical protein
MSFRIGSFIQAAAEEHRAATHSSEAHGRALSQALGATRERSVPYRRRRLPQADRLPALECQHVTAPTASMWESWAQSALP